MYQVEIRTKDFMRLEQAKTFSEAWLWAARLISEAVNTGSVIIELKITKVGIND